ncbi:ABC transporter substrate-binding protein [Mycoplasma mycoides subsp. mycoides]|uniref:Oligopeptide ABC transporter, substrate-binding component n=1 Tax=Mycoplasma mycoides subsp. mycoides SC (strain CCUG 32753 / NCTC 10114 / PG1) TaxID=272632 RepID=Q6MS18_MYCMS|nr:ABC transporter substrate-binding protein [Mycoplasma mycoides]CAE77573.1 Oligopeptide ABC transporter, substrate-binding component [Mycoplasma mycoides subsp. mycoides SC str. PG1]ADK69625.1 bacterial extracellular solute-binding protein, family 5 [Mycoplasma mycoides subsp. mycoides SC str. Gladysdale]AIZ55830.1 ABC-type oligopeptide transport system, periplasmic component [Mycoplasma mycoides subsp. mycoides]AME11142.1 oligopeptide ABC transporter, substrate-binding component [Mycoplasma 
MKKITKFSIIFGGISAAVLASSIPLIVASTRSKKEVRNYDLGLVAEPINSLNYIKFASVSKVLPSLVEAPLKSGPSENLKRILSIPEIPMGAYTNDIKLTDSDIEKGITSIDKYYKTKEPSANLTSRFYALDGFGNTTGTLSADKSTYHPASILLSNNKVQSANILLNNGQSRWSNNDEVVADDYVDALHYILDLSTGSQRLTNILQRKFANAQTVVDLQNEYIRKFGVTYNNPFQYPKIKEINGKYLYDVFNEEYKKNFYASQIDHILKNSSKYKNRTISDKEKQELIKEEKQVLDKLQNAIKKLGLYSGRLYWNYSNREILSSIPYSPDFDPNADETIIMLPNLEYLNPNLSSEQRKNTLQRKAVKIKKYLFSDPRQKFGKEFEKLLQQSRELKGHINTTYSENNLENYNKEVNKAYKNPDTLSNEFIDSFDAKKYRWHRELALDEYSLRVEYAASEPTSISNVIQDMLSTLFPINRKFVELNGGINDFGLTKERFLTTGAFNLDDAVLGPQGYLLLSKNPNYYSAPKTISNKIKIFFSSNPNINAALYDDKYIAATRIPAISQLPYWTNQEYRKYMKKSAGFGTIALAFNLDQERYDNLDKNSDSRYIYDSDLRNAIYYAINRDEMLNIVGWNSSYPVITWTAFGQGSSSFGDAIEIAFDHDEMYTKVDDKKAIPVQNYKHIDHLSKSYNFEHVDRTDKGFDLNIANKYLDLFKQKHPNVKSLTLKYISNSTDEQQNAGIALQDFMRKAFNGFINIEIKSLPENVYEYARTKGEFDLLYRNFDAFGSDAYSYVRVFFRTDGIDSKNAKTTGFRNNPSGSFTYEKYFSEIGYKLDESGKVVIDQKHKTEAEKLRTRLRINEKLWNKILELSFRKTKYKDKNVIKEESLSEYTERVNAFFTNQYTSKEINEEKWTEQSSFGIIGALEKIIRDAAPVVPLMEVDTYWEISRVNGSDNLFTYSLQFAYDTAFPPSPKLPTDIKETE